MKIIKTGSKEMKEALATISSRGDVDHRKEEETVKEIIVDIKERGDEALFEYTKKFDGADITPENILVTKEEIEEAYEKTDHKLIEIIRKAIKRITDFHENEKEKSWFVTEESGALLGQRVVPLSKAGLYVPGGKAAYPSSVLMNIIPAKVAGVEDIIVCTPCNAEGKVAPVTLVAANEAGADRIFKIGGAQAIAAMAYGTETVPKVDKITGPGNIYVALAKKNVYGEVSIDSVAGPSEITVICDETANPRFIAADLLSQAEHDQMASAICITTDPELAEKISSEVEAFIPTLSRKEIIRKSIDDYGKIFVAQDMEEAVDIANAIASEHLEIVTKDPFDIMPKIKNAGAIFLGSYSSEPLGDYFAGPNHVLPTSGTARFFSALSVQDFIKKQSIVNFNRSALEALHEDIEAFAESEGLTAHANSIQVRFE